MTCDSPYMRGSIPTPCGKCTPCGIDKTRVWTHRLMLENNLHADSVFVTLTYDEKHLPAKGYLQPKHLKAFHTALQKLTKFRYYSVGEYGDTSKRPHYHCILFGVSYLKTDLIKKCWTKGFSSVDPITPQRLAYTAGYTVKKYSKIEDPNLPKEFSRISNRPAIGLQALPIILEALKSPHGMEEFHAFGDVPTCLNWGKSKWPLGPFLRSKLRTALGLSAKASDSNHSLQFTLEVQALRNGALYGSQTAKKALNSLFPSKDSARILSIKARHQIFQSRKSI